MKYLKSPQPFIGFALVIASIWIGAWGQELTSSKDSYYTQPAIATAVITLLIGVALIADHFFNESEKP